MHSLFALSRKYYAFLTYFSSCLAFRFWSPTCFQSILKGLYHKMWAEDLQLTTCQGQRLQDSPEINNCLSTECYSVILNFPYKYKGSQSDMSVCSCRVVPKSRGREGTCTVAVPAAMLDGLNYQTQIPKKGKNQITKGALLFIENVKIM